MNGNKYKKTICLEEKFKMFKGSFELLIAVISQNIFKYFTLPCHTLTYFKYLKYISNGPQKNLAKLLCSC